MATNLQKEFSLANADDLFKTKFLKYYENTYNTANPTMNRVRKDNGFVGKKLEFPVPTSYKGGIGSGSLPETKNATYSDVVILSKKVYATDRVDRETIMASMSSEGAFVKAIAECIKKTVEADTWNHSRILFGNGDGSLGTLKASAAVTDNTGGNYSVIVGEAASTFKEANFEENMFVNFASNTELFEIQSVTPSTRVIVVQRQAGGSYVPAVSNVVYLQGSKDNDPHGLRNILDATAGTLYTVPVSRKWQAFQEDVTTGITTDLMNKVMTRIDRRVGVAPNLITTSFAQYEKILNLMEDDKRYSLATSAPKGYENVKGVLGFSGVQFMSSRGSIEIYPDKFVEDDRMYFLNTDHLVSHRRPNSGWVKEDIGGNGYLRVADEDQFEARLATYCNNFIAPTFHGRIKGLTV